MEVRAVAKYTGLTAQKVRLVCDLVRGMEVNEAISLLKFTNRAAAEVVGKTIASAMANAEENYGLSRDDLYVAQIMADEAPTLRRGRAGARGRYKPMVKRSSHVTVIVADREV